MAWRRCDDRDGSVDDVQPVELGFGGQVFVVHLGPKNRQRLAEQMETWLEGVSPRAPMPVVGDASPLKAAPAKTRKERRRVTPDDQSRNAIIREWAERNGFAVKGLGRLPNDVVAAYNAREND